MTTKVHKKVTIRDIADLVGIHHSTVSRALSPGKRSLVSPKLSRKIHETAEKLGYFPNLLAASLRQNRSFAIGVLIPDLMNPLFPPIIRGIQDTAEAAAFTVMIANTDDEEIKEQLALRSMRSRSIEGIIIATARRDDPVVTECINQAIPFVLINCSVDYDGVNTVVVDEEFAMRATLDHLIEKKHQRIAHIAGPQHTWTGFQRAKFFTNYMRSNGLQEHWIEVTSKFTVEEGYRALKRLFSRNSNFTAIVAGSDMIALGCIDAISEAGLSIPGDISVVGNNDIPLLAQLAPALTTVSIPKYEMGSEATKILLNMIGAVNTRPVTLKMQPKLVGRNSTKTYCN